MGYKGFATARLMARFALDPSNPKVGRPFVMADSIGYESILANGLPDNLVPHPAAHPELHINFRIFLFQGISMPTIPI